MIDLEQFKAALAPITRAPVDEKEFQGWGEQCLERAGFWFEREVNLGEGPVDFVLGTTAVEMKVKASAHEVTRQMARYLQNPAFTDGIILATREIVLPFDAVECRHGEKKPILMVALWRQFL